MVINGKSWLCFSTHFHFELVKHYLATITSNYRAVALESESSMEQIKITVIAIIGPSYKKVNVLGTSCKHIKSRSGQVALLACQIVSNNFSMNFSIISLKVSLKQLISVLGLIELKQINGNRRKKSENYWNACVSYVRKSSTSKN